MCFCWSVGSWCVGLSKCILLVNLFARSWNALLQYAGCFLLASRALLLYRMFVVCVSVGFTLCFMSIYALLLCWSALCCLVRRSLLVNLIVFCWLIYLPDLWARIGFLGKGERSIWQHSDWSKAILLRAPSGGHPYGGYYIPTELSASQQVAAARLFLWGGAIVHILWVYSTEIVWRDYKGATGTLYHWGCSAPLCGPQTGFM